MRKLKEIQKLQKLFEDINYSKINEYLQMHGEDWITWINNPLKASHMDRVWDRQIIITRSIHNFLVKTHGKSLDD